MKSHTQKDDDRADAPDVIVVGSINVDQIIRVERHPAPGETILARSLTHRAGGKGANQAVAAALQGSNVAFIGAHGTDVHSEVALSGLKAAGVDLTEVSEIDTPTGFAGIHVSEDGENCIVVVPGANALVSADRVRAGASAIQAARLVLLQGELPPEAFEEAVGLAKSNGLRTVVNLAPVIEVSPSALLEANPLIANEHEASLILRMLGYDTPPDSSFSDIARYLLEAGFSSVVLTLGAEGAVVAERCGEGNSIHRIPSPKVNVVDTTGAGDAFAGALAARIVAGDSLVSSVEHAVRVGAYSVQHEGAQSSYPDINTALPSTD
ncbi:ribokinase [Corynebacterium sp. TAE3-ERU2]|uniref:ribokinase n=1 Tax=Corynebacterium sp. TAE3-ERU2 TaxID=2849497 RepID=UPI001C44DB5E|nr:ribokinase [Corynebacterium sp. TAE3-ERU2]MBV7302403.1 ribokinase [Corynebacterium sp. TAE3-ERU2]